MILGTRGASCRPVEGERRWGEGAPAVRVPGTPCRGDGRTDRQHGSGGTEVERRGGQFTWHLVHGREHRALDCGVAAASATLIIEAERQVRGGRGADAEAHDFCGWLDWEVQEGCGERTL